MTTHADKIQENKSQSATDTVSKKQSNGDSVFKFIDKPSEVVILILVATIFASYIRKPQLFQQRQNN